MKTNFKKNALLFSLLIMIFFTSCKAKTPDFSNKVKIVTTIFPVYEWTHNLSFVDNNVKDNTILSLLVKNGVDLHSYQPSVSDLSQISNCDLFIYIGGESDSWIQPILEIPENKNLVSINLSEFILNSPENQNLNLDEHIWLSVKNTIICCEAIYKGLCQVNPKLKENYEKRFYEYNLKLKALEKQYEAEIKNINNKPIIFCDRFPLKNLCNDYNISYYSAFADCSAESEASFESISYLSKIIDENDVKNVLVSENSDKKIAKTVIMNTDKHKFDDIFVIDTFQNSTLRDAFNGKTYIKTMENNLANIKKALE